MPDSDIVTDACGPTAGVVIAGVGNVHHGAVLNAAALADANRVHIAPDDCAGPDRAVVAEFDIANDRCRRVDKTALAKSWGVAVKAADGRCILEWHD